jgi:hypothetical protein
MVACFLKAFKKEWRCKTKKKPEIPYGKSEKEFTTSALPT